MGGGIADKDEDEHTVMVYQQGLGWRTLPRYRYRYFGMAVLQDQLTLVGGWDSFTSEATNQISVWNAQQWTQPYPPMPTPRDSSAVVTYMKWLVVAGGSDGGSFLTAVEVMDSTNKQWFLHSGTLSLIHQSSALLLSLSMAHYWQWGDAMIENTVPQPSTSTSQGGRNG